MKKDKPLTATDVLESHARFYREHNLEIAELNLAFAKVQAEMTRTIVKKMDELIKIQEKIR